MLVIAGCVGLCPGSALPATTAVAPGVEPCAIFTGYDYRGYDILKEFFVWSVGECCQRCKSYPGCNAWATDASLRCYLKTIPPTAVRTVSPGQNAGCPGSCPS
eukprot:TRINITY_DN22634_c0_g1_i1.p3 TRINITY_DN22634_c0_g1~~TRINITY_DN22634_c0_g1_i1.p3  ORF type:complete len:103 (+),score=14.35 TRINITY_DN22634_c0_g1_i1:173-481(+)